jgi:hypothetical protein
MKTSLSLIISGLALAGCEAQIDADAARQERPAAVAKAEAGTLSIDAPGFDMKLKIPEVVRANVSSEGALVYPGATLGGLHVTAGADSAGANGSVEMRFTTRDALEKVAAWYRDPARAAELVVATAVRDSTGIVISGTGGGESGSQGGPFTLRLTPAAGGGTEGRLVLSDRGR